MTADDVAEFSGGTANQKLLSRLENGHAHLKAMRNDKYRALAAALSWTEDEFQAVLDGRPVPQPNPPRGLRPTPSGPCRRPASYRVKTTTSAAMTPIVAAIALAR